MNFWEARYRANTYPCRRAIANIQEYIYFYTAATTGSFGFKALRNKLTEFAPYLKSTHTTLKHSTDRPMQKLVVNAQDYLEYGQTFHLGLNCSHLSTLYAQAVDSLCVQTQPLSSSIVGAVICIQMMTCCNFILSVFLIPRQFEKQEPSTKGNDTDPDPDAEAVPTKETNK